MFRRAVAWRFVCGCYLVCRPDLTRPKFTDGLAPVKWSTDGLAPVPIGSRPSMVSLRSARV